MSTTPSKKTPEGSPLAGREGGVGKVSGRGLGRGLGRGVDALFFQNQIDAQKTAKEGVNELALSAIVPGRFQPRKLFSDESAAELTASVKIHGVIQPIVVRHLKDKQVYEIIAGERRYRAAKAAGLRTIPAVVRDYSDQEAALLGLIENLQREDLNCLEEAEGIARIINEYRTTHEKCAEMLSKSRSAITNSLRLLELSEPVKDMLRHSQLEMGHARALLTLTPTQQSEVARWVVDSQSSVRDTEKKVRSLTQPHKPPKDKKSLSSEWFSVKNQLEERVGLLVDISVDKMGAGSVNFRFSQVEQVNRLLSFLLPSDYPQPPTTHH